MCYFADVLFSFSAHRLCDFCSEEELESCFSVCAGAWARSCMCSPLAQNRTHTNTHMHMKKNSSSSVLQASGWHNVQEHRVIDVQQSAAPSCWSTLHCSLQPPNQYSPSRFLFSWTIWTVQQKNTGLSIMLKKGFFKCMCSRHPVIL